MKKTILTATLNLKYTDRCIQSQLIQRLKYAQQKKLLWFVSYLLTKSPQLCHLWCRCLIFPLSLKVFHLSRKWQKVTQLFKKSYRQGPSNYRPTSVLPTMSKILEKIVCTQLYAQLCDNHLLADKQFGFRLKASTVTATAQFTGLTTMENIMECSLAQYSLSLLRHLIQSTTLYYCQSWIVSVFWMILQLVNGLSHTFPNDVKLVCNNSQSDKAVVPIGVPQGSSLVPLLFTVYINDLPDRLEHYMQMMLSYSFPFQIYS